MAMKRHRQNRGDTVELLGLLTRKPRIKPYSGWMYKAYYFFGVTLGSLLVRQQSIFLITADKTSHSTMA
ncbi:uncharacterized protein K444DRAFT_272103 [Hyaloscypha bicolor E]|uniref:Uncharacterized protein n=1 Tax=Hyaloscypha bicolor E TaxID=1095630 RepID=A0A2J6SIG4_9HELO|nr:uncharacterized protein K444DRAFT_272103 [Hyaloscypha bicolor E]PMD50562.1 hypothetical protein K444DRAFT_272103 [Hyaloscypha bicolor E]